MTITYFINGDDPNRRKGFCERNFEKYEQDAQFSGKIFWDDRATPESKDLNSQLHLLTGNPHVSQEHYISSPGVMV